VQLFRNGKALPQILAEVYPEYNWEVSRFTHKTLDNWEKLFQGNNNGNKHWIYF
jgi:hypothetical protein